MRFSSFFFTALSLATSATAIPVAAEKRDAEVSVSVPIWPHFLHLLKVHSQARTPTPIGSFISIWYGEDGDDDDSAAAKIKRDAAPIGSFISIWYGEDGDDDDDAAAKSKRGVMKRAPDFKVR
jgi:hypothetical protein